jgi:hypothetical protein
MRRGSLDLNGTRGCWNALSVSIATDQLFRLGWPSVI